LSNFCILTKERFYHFGASENNRNAILEAIVLNYESPIPVLEKAMQQLAIFEERARYTPLALTNHSA